MHRAGSPEAGTSFPGAILLILEEFRLDGKVALVTGAATGLGAAMALGLSQAGARLVLATRETPLDATAQLIPDPVVIQSDLTRADDRERTIAHAIERCGRLDILVNNAGTTLRRPTEEMAFHEWRAVLDLNLDAVFHLCQLAGRHMLARGSGKIINIASLMSFQGGLRIAPYSASKGAVAQLTKELACEWAGRGVNVNAIAPGYFRTRMGEPLYNDPVRMPQILDRIPSGRIGDPEELSGAVVFLASAASNYVHGHLLVVDGGWLAR